MLQDLKTKHRTMMEDMVLNGLTAREVCEKYDMSEGRFSIVRRSPLWRVEEAELRKEHQGLMRKRMESLLPKALNTIQDCMDSAQDAVRVSAAKEVFNRGGLPANIVFSDEDPADIESYYGTLEEIQNQKRQLAEELGLDSPDKLMEAINARKDTEEVGEV